MWKDVERHFSKLLQAERNLRKGLAEPDIIKTLKISEKDVEIAFEVKFRSKVPAQVKKMLEQAIANAKGQMPIVLLKEKYSRYDDAMVIMRFSDFMELVK